MVYCDYIADRIHRLVSNDIGDNQTMLLNIGKAALDLHPTEGYFVSTKKTMEITDANGKVYVVTVEEKA
ncbi:hypothetical protein N9R43_00930 [bacterium]|nr:hypothetical protein [bacterium]